jgi:hypothetical protein
MSSAHKRVAFCLRGGVSKTTGLYRSCVSGGGDKYINYQAVANSIRRHIFEANASCDIDVFIQSWNIDLKEILENIYNPKLSLFEDNSFFAEEIRARCHTAKDFPGVSQALAMKKSIELMESYALGSGFVYDLVVIYRPDVLLWKDMVFDWYDPSKGLYVNGHHGGNGDFHFVMSFSDAVMFKGVYDSPLSGNRHALHHWIKNYVVKSMGRQMIMDAIAPGRHQEVARPDKIKKFSIGRYRVPPRTLQRYGMTNADMGI